MDPKQDFPQNLCCPFNASRKLQGLKDYLTSIGTEKTLVAAVDGFWMACKLGSGSEKMARFHEE